MSVIENRIDSQKKKIAVLDDRIGRLMSKRVSEEDKLADLYEAAGRARNGGNNA